LLCTKHNFQLSHELSINQDGHNRRQGLPQLRQFVLSRPNNGTVQIKDIEAEVSHALLAPRHPSQDYEHGSDPMVTDGQDTEEQGNFFPPG